MYTWSGVSVQDDEGGTPDTTLGGGETSGFRGWCHVTSRECTTLPLSESMIFKQSLPWLYPKFRKKHRHAWRSILLRRGTRWYADLQNGKTSIDGRSPKNTSCGGSMPLFAVVAERLNPSEAHKTDSIHRLEPSGSRTPLSFSRWTSGKSFSVSIRAACPALIVLESPLSTGPFCCGVYGTVTLWRIWRPLQ